MKESRGSKGFWEVGATVERFYNIKTQKGEGKKDLCTVGLDCYIL